MQLGCNQMLLGSFSYTFAGLSSFGTEQLSLTQNVYSSFVPLDHVLSDIAQMTTFQIAMKEVLGHSQKVPEGCL